MIATVIMARCLNTKRPFAMRAEKTDSGWCCTWAFKLDEKSAKSEGYDKTIVKGNVFMRQDYPGCPHCGASGFYQCCNCGKIICYDHNLESAKCPECGNVSGFTTGEDFNISGSGY